MTKRALLTVSFALTVCFNSRLVAQMESEVIGALPAAAAGQCLPECDDGPCFALQAVAVNGQPIPPTGCVNVNPGDVIETEVRISNWGTALPNGANLYETFVDPEASAKTGDSGLILPLGWDGPVPTVRCYSAADCPGTRWSCMGAKVTYPPFPGTCLGPDHNPAIGIALDVERPDFIFAGSPLDSMMPFGMGSNHLSWYVWFAMLELGEHPHPMAFDTGYSSYAATLRLQVSSDACGNFLYKFGPSDRNYVWFYQPPVEATAYGHLFPLSISVDCDCNDDGIADWEAIADGRNKDCNGNGKPDYCDIRDKTSADVDGNRIPDECRVERRPSGRY